MSDIKNAMIKGLAWSAIEKYSVFLVSLIVSMVLARLLAPKDFGGVAIATVIINFLSIFSTMGIGPAIIQRKNLSNDDINNIFSFSVIISLILTLIFFASSWLIAHYYSEAQLITICHVLCINLFFGGINMVPSALMAKNRRFKEIAIRTVVLQILTGAIAVYAAYNGFGVYSLLISPTVTSIAMMFYNCHFYPVKFKINIDIKIIKSIFSYSSYQFGFEFINYFSRNLDKLIIGKYISANALGYYDKSYRLMQLPAGQLTGVINPVLQPIMSTLQDDMTQMAQKYNKIISFIATISFPLAIYLFFSGKELICVFYGNSWIPAVTSFEILALSLPTQMILSTSGGIWQSCNSTKLLFVTGAINTGITIAGFIIAAYCFSTIEAVAAAWTITSVINFFITYVSMYRIVLRHSIMSMLRQLISPIVNAILLSCIYIALKNVFYNSLFLESLILKTLLGFIVSLVYLGVTGKFNVIVFLKQKCKRNEI